MGSPFRDREESTEPSAQSDRVVSCPDQRNVRWLCGPLLQGEGDCEAVSLRRCDLGLVSKAEVALGGR
ncbi:hypothetical protein GCM10010394_15020 [Streptomyces crystallinus]|uniref:Uncharacterized protein n=1 Tax=Streptomyces crystallinus TaxID=68191 RepID=A0ABN1FB43_9ACTN